MKLKSRSWRSWWTCCLLLCLASSAAAHEGHSHGAAPPPQTASQRLTALFVGDIPDPLPYGQPLAIMRTGTAGDGTPVQLRFIYTPEFVFLGRQEPFRLDLTTPGTGKPLEGYAPKVVVSFPSGQQSRGEMYEIAGHPGLYEYTPTWRDAGAASIEVRIGQGPQAPLQPIAETIHVKAPVVPWTSWLMTGGLFALVVGAILANRLPSASRPLIWSLTCAVAIGGAVVWRAPLAASSERIARAELAALDAAEVDRQATWPDPVAELDVVSPIDDALLPSSTRPSLPLGPGTVRGTLIIPDDGRALVSSPYIGTFTTSQLLPRGTQVRRGQSLGSIRVNNEGVAPSAAAAPGEIAAANSELAAAQSVLAQAEADLQRGQMLYDADAIPRRELEGYARAVEQAQAAVTAAEGHLAAARESAQALQRLGGQGALRSHGVSSPIDGVVTAVGVSPGEGVTEGQMLFTIVDPSRLWIEAALYEDQVATLQPGDTREFVLGTDPARKYIARLRSLGVMLDTESGTLPALFEVEAPLDGLIAGQAVWLLPAEASK